MELYSLQVASITLYCGMFYITGRNYEYMNNNVLKWFFLTFLVLPNVLFAVYWLLFLLLEILKVVHQKSRLLFRICTLGLVDYEKFKLRYPLQTLNKDYANYLQKTLSPGKSRKNESEDGPKEEQVE
jgi:hypothetical protein